MINAHPVPKFYQVFISRGTIVEQQLILNTYLFPINNHGWSIMHATDANVKFYHSPLSLPGKKIEFRWNRVIGISLNWKSVGFILWSESGYKYPEHFLEYLIFCPVIRIILSPVLCRDVWFLIDGEENKLHVSAKKAHRNVCEHTHRQGQHNAVGIVTSYRMSSGGFGLLLLQGLRAFPPKRPAWNSAQTFSYAMGTGEQSRWYVNWPLTII